VLQLRSDDELREVAGSARPLRAPPDLDPLIERIGDSRYVLLGEASHGTHEYYCWRAWLTQRLVAECGFTFVAVEGDWPDCFDVNCWVKGHDTASDRAADVLNRFERWPTWMWANREVAEFADWLRDHNARTGAGVGFYGLDVYSLWESIDRIVGYLGEHAPDTVGTALAAARCFEPYGGDPQRYAAATRLLPEDCEDAVITLLGDVHRFARRDGASAEADFDALQNAEVLAGAERYYRTMVRGGAESWNVRDCHMVDTLDRLMAHQGPGAKAVVWEHNTHVGDAAATDMASVGMLNVGQLVRRRHAAEGVLLVGFGGYAGSVIAAARWGAPMEVMPVPEAIPGSHEDLIHHAVGEPCLFVFPDDRNTAWLAGWRGHRAIGVVYEPRRDRLGNWVPTVLGRRYDAFLSFEMTEALHPLHLEPAGLGGERETYPWNT
jgi:erythromycin esterase